MKSIDYRVLGRSSTFENDKGNRLLKASRQEQCGWEFRVLQELVLTEVLLLALPTTPHLGHKEPDSRTLSPATASDLPAQLYPVFLTCTFPGTELGRSLEKWFLVFQALHLTALEWASRSQWAGFATAPIYGTHPPTPDKAWIPLNACIMIHADFCKWTNTSSRLAVLFPTGRWICFCHHLCSAIPVLRLFETVLPLALFFLSKEYKI